MPAWVLPTFAGIVAFLATEFALSSLAKSVGVPLWLRGDFIDSYGELQTSSSTRAGFLVGLIALSAGAWAAAAVHTRRLDCKLAAREWRFVGAVFGALLVYVAVMHTLTVTFKRQTDALPDVLFNVLDLGILISVGYAAYRIHSRRSR